jgi:microcin C transport system substrate-binding protein
MPFAPVLPMMTRRRLLAGAAAFGALPLVARRARAQAAPAHGIAMHTALKYGPDFVHLEYANPDAPKGGALREAAVGSFDSLNPFIVSGNKAAKVGDYLHARMLTRVWDEPFSLYGYVAEAVEMPDDRRSVSFWLNPKAAFHDGSPITVDDVIFTMETLREKGIPSARRAYGNIASADRIEDRGVRFNFVEGATREAPMLMGLMAVLSRAWFTANPLDQATLEPPLGSGPYKIAAIDAGRSISYQRVADWWAADLPAMRGLYNFDTLQYDYFRDATVALEAFKAGDETFRREDSAETWVSGAYDSPAVSDGRITMISLPQFRAQGMTGFAMNMRRPMFADERVRRAMILAFDFEWINKTLLAGQYKRIDSYFANSNLAARGTPEGAELALLEPFRDQLPPALFTTAPSLPSTDGSGRNRENLRAAQALLAEAGWVVSDGALQDASGAPFTFEIMLNTDKYQRIALAYVDQLQRLGARVSVRVVDSAQYVARQDGFDFDMIADTRGVTMSPGTEQALYWSSAMAGTPGSRNYVGLASPAVDSLIDDVANARNGDELQAAVHALDRVLLWGSHYVPFYYADRDFFAYWGNLQRVEDVDPLYGTVIESWWQGA